MTSPYVDFCVCVLDAKDVMNVFFCRREGGVEVIHINFKTFPISLFNIQIRNFKMNSKSKYYTVHTCILGPSWP